MKFTDKAASALVGAIMLLLVSPTVAVAQVVESTCDFDGVVGYFTGSGIVKAVLTFLSVGVMLFFALTKKSIPGVLRKILEIVADFLGRKK